MQEYELISNIIKGSNEAIIAIDLAGKVTLWNKSAERLFGYQEKETLGKPVPFIKNKFSYELDTVINSAKEGKSLNFKTTKESKNKDEMDLVISTTPLYKNNEVVGVSAIIQEASLFKKISYLSFDIPLTQREPKRTFSEIRDIIFLTLSSGKKTINQISTESDINWRTVEKHLTYLIGKRYVNEIFSSEYVRIFELTPLGYEYTEEIKNEHLERHIRKA